MAFFANMNTNSTDSFLLWSPVFVILYLLQVCTRDWQKECSTYHYQVLQSSNLHSHSEFINHSFWYCSCFPCSISFFSTIEWSSGMCVINPDSCEITFAVMPSSSSAFSHIFLLSSYRISAVLHTPYAILILPKLSNFYRSRIDSSIHL